MKIHPWDISMYRYKKRASPIQGVKKMQNKKAKFVAPLLALAVTFGALTAVAQQKTSSSKAKQETTAKKEKSKYHRLPTNFGKLELTEEQISEIYAIKDDMGPKIDALTKELAEMKAEQDQKIKDVLTRTQVTALNKLKDGSRSGEGFLLRKGQRSTKGTDARCVHEKLSSSGTRGEVRECWEQSRTSPLLPQHRKSVWREVSRSTWSPLRELASKNT